MRSSKAQTSSYSLRSFATSSTLNSPLRRRSPGGRISRRSYPVRPFAFSQRSVVFRVYSGRPVRKTTRSPAACSARSTSSDAAIGGAEPMAAKYDFQSRVFPFSPSTKCARARSSLNVPSRSQITAFGRRFGILHLSLGLTVNPGDSGRCLPARRLALRRARGAHLDPRGERALGEREQVHH